MQPFFNDLHGVLDRVFQGTLPHDGHAPAEIIKSRHMTGITVNISLEFLPPEILVCPGSRGVSTAFMPVPEAAMNEYHGPVLRKDQVRRARQFLYMKPVSESPRKQGKTQHPLRAGVLAANARHHAAALWGGWNTHGLGYMSSVCWSDNAWVTPRNPSARVDAWGPDHAPEP